MHFMTFHVLVSTGTIEGFSELLEGQENAIDLLSTPFQIGIKIKKLKIKIWQKEMII